MFTIQTLTIGDLSTNCYLLINDETKETLIIDPADDANFISEEILRQNLYPVAIIATHGHFDHILAAWELEMAFTIRTLIHSDDVFLFKIMNRSASWWLKKRIVEKPPQNIIAIDHPSPISDLCALHFAFRVIPTPGHTPGSICLYLPKEKSLISGDTIFAHGIVGRTDLPYASSEKLHRSIKKLRSLPPKTIIYPGHGETSDIGSFFRDYQSHN